MMLLRAVVAFWLVLGSVAFAAEPFTRVAIEDKGSIVPGQQVRITVDVFVPDFFTSPPELPLFDLPNAMVSLVDERSQNLIETIDGVQYAGIRRTYAVVPETSGTFTLPPAVITLGYSQDGKPLPGQAVLQPLSFTVADPPDSSAATPAFPARGVTITQSFDRDPSKLKVGDAVVRTMTIFAENTQAMMIPAIPAVAANGLKQYSKSPQLADGVETDDRRTGSTRTETITYVAGTEGTFEIPAISYPWFNVDTQASAMATLPAATMRVAAPASAHTGLAPQLEQEVDTSAHAWLTRKHLLAAAAAAIGLAAAGYVLLRLLPWITERLRTRRNARRNSERSAFADLIASIGSGDPGIIYRHLEIWTRAAGYKSIADWVLQCGDDDAATQIRKLESELFGAGRNRPALDRAALRHAIEAWRKIPKPGDTRHAASLPGLNPIA